MKVNLPNAATLTLDSSSNELYGYFLVSNRWTVMNDANITFVRKNALGYCYNLDWGGPLTRHEALKLRNNSAAITIVSIATIKPFLKTTNDKIYLPNTADVRKAIGIDNEDLQLAN
ncbi:MULTISPECIES: hypothetical protein [unclassified Flavobacterium]|uniref:hypothetical protein n=1 Tax=unclassified Flavobacterium TaxID=196869 RepID=UPI00131D4B40|nr:MULTISPECIES: hypothetical protein [unclassified Flavobacterium]